MQISNIGSDNKTDIKDVTYSKTYSDKDINGSGGPTVISLGSLGSITLVFDYPNGLFNATDVRLTTDGVETKYGANLTFESTWNGTTAKNGSIQLGEEDDESNGLMLNLSLVYYPTDDEVRIRT